MILLWLGIEPTSEAHAKRLSRGLAALLEEDRSLAVSIGDDGTIALGALSEEHMERAVDRLKREFGVEAKLTRPQIAYKEALTRSADGEMKYAVQAGGRGQYGHVKLRVHPREAGSGYVFENEVTQGAIPDGFIASIDEGVQTALVRGVLGGYPIEDVRVVLYDGSYHDVDSTEEAFRIAAAVAVQDAARKANPILLEPIMTLEVPARMHEAPTLADQLRRRRGEVLSRVAETSDGVVTIRARVPLAEMFGFGADLRQRTHGAGVFTMTFSHYAPVATNDDDGDREAAVTAPLRPRTPLRSLRASVPEPPPDDEKPV